MKIKLLGVVLAVLLSVVWSASVSAQSTGSDVLAVEGYAKLNGHPPGADTEVWASCKGPNGYIWNRGVIDDSNGHYRMEFTRSSYCNYGNEIGITVTKWSSPNSGVAGWLGFVAVDAAPSVVWADIVMHSNNVVDVPEYGWLVGALVASAGVGVIAYVRRYNSSGAV